jgi:hypothetical protein
MRPSIPALALLAVFGTALADGAAVPASSAAPGKTTDRAPASSRVCPQDTGSRLPRKEGECLSSGGRTYSSDELRSTGASNNAEALRRMDPSLTVSH